MSNHGGKRQGAGRPKGAAAKLDEEARQAALEQGESPLEYMLRVMRDEGADERRRDDMAKAASPYVHAKLASVEVTGEDGGPLKIVMGQDDDNL